MALRSDGGVALVLVLMSVLLLSALGTALVLTTSTETLIAGNFRAATEARYAAEAAADWAIDELSGTLDWAAVLDGTLASAVVDGPATGRRILIDGTEIDLDAAASTLSGGRLYAYGYLSAFVPDVVSPLYIVAVVAPVASDSGRLIIRADAIGPRGIRQAVEVAITRRSGLPGGLWTVSWRPVA